MNYSPMALATLALCAAPSLYAQGRNIGDPTGRAGLWPLLESPIGNPFEADPGDAYKPLAGSETEKKILLGKMLFWDEQVSSDNTMACATCHIPETAGIDFRGSFPALNLGNGSLGVLPQDTSGDYIAGTPLDQQQRVTGIIAPTMLGAAFARRLFWDARALRRFRDANDQPFLLNGVDQFPDFAALESQAVDPPMSSTEMAHDGLAWNTGELEAKLGNARPLALATLSTVPVDILPQVTSGAVYNRLFDLAFFNDPNFDGFPVGVTRERFALAIAAYERTLIPNQAPIDTRALTQSEMDGFNHLLGSDCFFCHSNQTTFFAGENPVLTGTGGFQNALDAMLTDNRVHGDIGFPGNPGATGQGQGSFNVKTPSLRNVMLKPSLTHNGFFTDINDLLAFYNAENGFNPTFPFETGSNPNGTLDASEKADVIAFFNALTDPRLVPAFPGAPLPPPFDHPDLYLQRVPFESNESPNHPGIPSVLGGDIPDILLNVPFLSDDTAWKTGVREAPLFSPAFIAISPNPLPPPTANPLHLNPNGMMVFGTVTDATGFATFGFGSPPASVVGTTWSFQWAVREPTNSRFAFSNAGELIVQ
ncbi:MAG: hypothetical protein GY711_09180 [bacterium]|nr:hypothetical protein [bacterium]